MKAHIRLAVLTGLIFTLVSAGIARAEIIPAHGEGQIGLQAVVLCKELTVRQGPGTSYKAARTLKYGDRIIVQPQTGGWAACFLSDSVDAGRAGWVSEDYLAVDPAWYRTDEKTPVYAWDDTTAPKVALLDKNTTLPILKDEGGWLVVSLRGAAGWIRAGEAAKAAAPADSPEAAAGRRDGERFEEVILLEGMEETVRYEHVVSRAVGIEMDYDYENFERLAEPDCERFVSRYDSPGNPLNCLEVRYCAEDADAVAASIIGTLSGEYDVVREPYRLDRAGSCIRIDASRAGGGNETPGLLRTAYVIPAAGGCVAAAAQCTIESAEGFGARIGRMMNTLSVVGGRAE